MRPAPLLIVLLIAMTTATCAENTQVDKDSTSDTGAFDAARDSFDEDVRGDTDARESDGTDIELDSAHAVDTGAAEGDVSVGDGDDGDDGGDAQTEAYTCTCPNEGDKCVILGLGQLVCIDPASEEMPCDDDQDCAPGYRCNIVRDLCVCDPEQQGEECFVSCEQGDCPRFHRCGPNQQCVAPQRCWADISCKRGEFCVVIETPETFRTNSDEWSFCAPGGPKEAGEPCSSDVECSSGTCRSFWDGDTWTVQCARHCLSDADCPDEGERCHPYDGFCTASGFPSCDTDCPSDQVCNGNYCYRACRNSADCTDGDCTVHPSFKENLGFCTTNLTGNPLCKPGEVRVHREDPFCRRANARCLEDEDCPIGYECVDNAPRRFQYPRPNSCARRVTDGPWPL